MTFTLEETLLEAKRVVFEKPDFVYRSPISIEYDEEGKLLTQNCVYTWQGQPSCVVGHIITNMLGHRVDRIEELFTELYPASHQPWTDEFDEDARYFLNLLQQYQDHGTRWEEAFNDAASYTHARFSK